MNIYSLYPHSFIHSFFGIGFFFYSVHLYYYLSATKATILLLLLLMMVMNDFGKFFGFFSFQNFVFFPFTRIITTITTTIFLRKKPGLKVVVWKNEWILMEQFRASGISSDSSSGSDSFQVYNQFVIIIIIINITTNFYFQNKTKQKKSDSRFLLSMMMMMIAKHRIYGSGIIWKRERETENHRTIKNIFLGPEWHIRITHAFFLFQPEVEEKKRIYLQTDRRNINQTELMDASKDRSNNRTNDQQQWNAQTQNQNETSSYITRKKSRNKKKLRK